MIRINMNNYGYNISIRRKEPVDAMDVQITERLPVIKNRSRISLVDLPEWVLTGIILIIVILTYVCITWSNVLPKSNSSVILIEQK
jgi:hypothetical protein